MRYRHLLLFIAAIIIFSCKKENQGIELPVPPPPPPPQKVLIKDVVLDRLPSPYYHFEYNTAGKVSFVSFASDFFRYDVVYDGDRISEMRNNILVNKDRLQYYYDSEGRVNLVTYADLTGLVFTRINLTYDGPKLIRLEREKKVNTDFVVDKIVAMTYYADGNLQDLTVHYAAVFGQPEITFNDRYEQYDNKINAEGFGLLKKDEFFDHFVFLPGVQLQKNNPGKETRTGNVDNYKVDYTYTYDNRGAPLTRNGDFVYTSGTSTGQKFQFGATYTYY